VLALVRKLLEGANKDNRRHLSSKSKLGKGEIRFTCFYLIFRRRNVK
jgi:hypothetical protein